MKGLLSFIRLSYIIWAVYGVLVILYIAIVLLAALVFSLYIKSGGSERSTPVLEFEPPEQFTPAEIGYIVDGYVDQWDIISIILYWAERGCLQVVQRSDGEIYIKKLRDLPQDARKFENTFFNGLFQEGDAVYITSTGRDLRKIRSGVESELKRSFTTRERAVFSSVSIKMQWLTCFLSSLPVVLAWTYVLYSHMAYGGTTFEGAFIAGAILAGAVTLGIHHFIRFLQSWRGLSRNRRNGRLLIYIVVIAFLVYYYWGIFKYEPALAIAALLATLLMVILSFFIRKRTGSGNQLQRKILGFKNYIETVPDQRTPEYFFQILPYAYVLGAAEKWADNFVEYKIDLVMPSWLIVANTAEAFAATSFIPPFLKLLDSIGNRFTQKPRHQGIRDGSS